jgi:hypothetical protein
MPQSRRIAWNPHPGGARPNVGNQDHLGKAAGQDVSTWLCANYRIEPRYSFGLRTSKLVAVRAVGQAGITRRRHLGQPACFRSDCEAHNQAKAVTSENSLASANPPAGVRRGDCAGQAGPGGVGDVQRVGDAVGGGEPQAHGVGARGGHVDRVLEPLPGRCPAQVAWADGRGGVLRVGGGLQVDPVRPVAVGGAVDRGDVRPLSAGVPLARSV